MSYPPAGPQLAAPWAVPRAAVGDTAAVAGKGGCGAVEPAAGPEAVAAWPVVVL